MNALMTDEMREAFERVTRGYYRAPSPGDATRALEVWLLVLDRASEEQVPGMMVLMYLFGRVAQESVEVRGAFEPIIASYAGANRELATGVLRPLPNVLAIVVDRPEILDLLWAEFFVTGRRAPLLRIVSALDARDVVRARLEAWLVERSWFGGKQRDEIATALAQVGLVVDLAQRVVVTAGDLDCLCFSFAEQQTKIFPMLPFDLTPVEVLQLGMKGSALWSLRLNASTHELVATVCREEATNPGGLARPMLAEARDGKPFAL